MRLWIACILLLIPALGTSAGPVSSDWGPFYSRRVDVQGHQRVRALGPVYEHIQTPEGWGMQAVRPLSVRWNHEETDFLRREFLWPLAQSSRFQQQRSWRVLLVFGTNWDVNDPESRHRLWVLPFYFHGRDIHGRDYRALFPFFGRIHEFLFWDEISFFLFPLRVRSRMNDIQANSWLWPIYSRTEGPGLRRFRIFPFYGVTEQKDHGRKQFVLWPFWTHVRYDREREPGTGWVLFPVTGHLKLETQQSWWILPPLFRLHLGEDRSRLFGPWPFVQINTGVVEKRYLWPLIGTKTIGNTRKDFLLWPIASREETVTDTERTSRQFVVPFYQNFRVEDTASGTVSSRYTKFWPLFSHSYRAEGPTRRTAFPDFNLFRAGPIERNFAPFWQLYLREQNGDAVDTEILWGLYRHAARGNTRYHSLFPLFQSTRGDEYRDVSLLKGFFGYRRHADKKSWRVLYLFRFGDREEPQEALP